MEKADFEGRIRALLPNTSKKVIDSWFKYGVGFNNEGVTHTFHRDVCIALELTVKHDGMDIAQKMINLGEYVCFNDYEILGTARLLREGVSIEDIPDKLLDGQCYVTAQEWEEFKAAQATWESVRKNESPAQAALHEPSIYEDEATAALHEQLMQRLDGNLTGYYESLRNEPELDITNISPEVAAMAGAHYYLTEIHNFHTSELEYLLKFQNPLKVVADAFEISGMDDHSDIMWEIFDKQDALQGGHEFMTESSEPHGLDKEELLRNRLAKNYDDYSVTILDYEKRELFNEAEQIASVKQAYDYLTEEHSFSESEVDFLLKFENPLEVFSDRWSATINDVSYDVRNFFEDQERALKWGGYELVPEDSLPTDASHKAIGAEKLSVMDKIRKAREEAKENPATRKGNYDKAREPER